MKTGLFISDPPTSTLIGSLRQFEKDKEMENKYYTPSIEDIRVGYECELFLPKDDWYKPEVWKPIKIAQDAYTKTGPYGGDLSELDEVCNLIGLGQVRTPYLTKEQIEAEGWEVTGRMLLANYARTGQDENQYLCKKDNWILIFIPEKKILRFTRLDYSRETTARGGYVDDTSVKFTVDLLSINEFRQICKLLKIS